MHLMAIAPTGAAQPSCMRRQSTPFGTRRPCPALQSPASFLHHPSTQRLPHGTWRLHHCAGALSSPWTIVHRPLFCLMTRTHTSHTHWDRLANGAGKMYFKPTWMQWCFVIQTSAVHAPKTIPLSPAPASLPTSHPMSHSLPPTATRAASLPGQPTHCFSVIDVCA